MRSLFISAFFIFFAFTAWAQNVKTGDAALDESLNSLTEQVNDKPDDFIKTNLALRFNYPFSKLANCIKTDKMEVSEVFLTAYLAVTYSKDLDSVISEVKNNNRDWAKILLSYNIKKNNKDYRRLLRSSINIHPKPFIPKVK